MLELLYAENPTLPRFDDAWSVLQLLASNAIMENQLDSIQDQCRNIDRIIHYLAYLLDILLSVAKSENELEMIKMFVRKLIHKDIRCATTGETLLHLSVKRDGFEHRVHGLGFKHVFRNGIVTKLLLECGAHIDSPDLNGVRPSELLVKNLQNDIPVNKFISLKCLCANRIIKMGISYEGIVSRTMEAFVREHQWQRAEHVSTTETNRQFRRNRTCQGLVDHETADL
ncbi:protein fem-1 homolog B-like [Toxorhynchites rutilus septentrionalis]|uniref:protein fem-1 homolog B-like n=1 Tax=Toxorhynchites rutilus septentrionalis TaxID=329112 RepID=UPI002478B3C2|nr:protein fem-1 homolog B-like [Toxorhynchites rutilus septentrionalis]